MPSTEHFLGFALLTLVLVAIPGPSVLFTVSRALNLGRRAALLSVLGNALGVYLQVIAVAVGLGALLTSSITAFTIVKLAGGAYLVFLGVQAIRHRRVQPSTEPDPATTRGSRVLREGFVVGATNPKMIVFLAAALPQFTDRGSAHASLHMLLLGMLVFVIALATDVVWALTASRARGWLVGSPRRLEAMTGVGGFAMVGLGASLTVSGRPD